MMDKKPVVLFSMPKDMSIYELMIENLKFCGFQVISVIPPMPEDFKYPSLGTHLKTKWQKIFLRRKDAKTKLKAELLWQQYQQVIQTQGVDYALFIRADIYHSFFLQKVRTHVKKMMINYQFDGINRYPAIWGLIKRKLFDRFYIFDPADLKYKDYNFLPATNFYFDYDLTPAAEIKYDFYFLGAHLDDRMPLINRFAELAQNNNWNLNFII